MLSRFPMVLTILLLLGGACRLSAGSNDLAGDAYLRGYLLKNQAERLEKTGDIPGAVQKYHEASQIITKIAHDYPDWQTKVVNFRLKAIEQAILRLCAKADLPVPSNDPKDAPPAKPSGAAGNAVPQAPLDLINRQFEENQKAIQEAERRMRERQREGNRRSIDPSANESAADEYYRAYLLRGEAERLEKAGDIPGAAQKNREASEIMAKVANENRDQSIDPGITAQRPPLDPHIVPK